MIGYLLGIRLCDGSVIFVKLLMITIIVKFILIPISGLEYGFALL